MEGWKLLKRKFPSCNAMTLLQANDMISSNRNSNSSSGSEHNLTVSIPKKYEDYNHVSNVPHCVGCKSHVVGYKTMIDSAPSIMNYDYNYYNYDNVTKGKTLVAFIMLDDNVDGSSAYGADHDGGVLFNYSDINNANFNDECLTVLEEDESLLLITNNDEKHHDSIDDESQDIFIVSIMKTLNVT